MWIAGFALAFVIPAGSLYIWLPDTLLLFGFYPLLIKAKARWLWLVFGVLNFLIGCALELTLVLPDEPFAKVPQAVAVKTHLAQYHVPLVWLGIGILSFLIGFCILSFFFIRWLIAKTKRSSP